MFQTIVDFVKKLLGIVKKQDINIDLSYRDEEFGVDVYVNGKNAEEIVDEFKGLLTELY